MSETKKVGKKSYDNTLKHLRQLKITTGFQSNQIKELKRMIDEFNITDRDSLHARLDRIELEYRRDN